MPERVGDQPRQTLGGEVEVVMKVARVGIEQRKLRLRRMDHGGVAVPHERHVVVDIQIRSPRVVIQILHPPANDFQRTLIRNAETICQQGAACGKRFAESRLSGWKAIGWNSQQQIRIWRKASPHWTLQRDRKSTRLNSSHT